MKQASPKTLDVTDAVKTYRYLRIGMISAAACLATAILIERSNAPARCLQDSISAYYYTPARGIFVGTLIAIGFGLVVIKGRTSIEDVFLNFAGMLAPVVALAPTTNVGRCYSLPPNPLPKIGDELAPWVIADVRNNLRALLVAGTVAFVVAAIVALVNQLKDEGRRETVGRGTTISLAVTAGALAGGWWAALQWKDVYTGAHAPAAILMFVFLFAAVTTKAIEHRSTARIYAAIYSTVAVGMIAGLVITTVVVGGEHKVFWLEATEIFMFAVFWIVQTVENWNEKPIARPAVAAR